MKRQKDKQVKKLAQWADKIIFGAVCILVIGLFSWVAEPGVSLLPIKPLAGGSYYNLLVQGFQAGQLNLKKEPPPELAQLSNPYNPALNANYIHDIVDTSYYHGKLYLYFGITPAITLFWPYASLTGNYLSDRDAVMIYFALGYVAFACLLYGIWKRYFAGLHIGIALAGLFIMGLITGTEKILTQWSSIYEISTLSGFAFVMVALLAIWKGLHDSKKQVWWLSLASAAYGLAVGSRPSLLFGAIMVLVPVIHAWSEKAGVKRICSLLMAAVGPLLFIGIGLMLYNFYRFNNPFEFGWHYQLNGSYEPSSARQFSLHYLWFNFFFYFFAPMRWNGPFPFLEGVWLPPYPPGFNGADPWGGGLLSNYPLMWLALAVPLAWKKRAGGTVSLLRWFLLAIFLQFVVCAITLCLFFTVGNRYQFDFLPALILLVIIGIFSLERALADSPIWRRIARTGWCIFLLAALILNVLLSAETRSETICLSGNVFLNQGRWDEAIQRYQSALTLWPESPNSLMGLGNAYLGKGQSADAITEYQKVLKTQPANACVGLGEAFFQAGQVDQAILYFQKAVELNPQSEMANIELAWLLATAEDPSLRNGDKAVIFAEQANRLSNNQDPLVLRVLAAAFAEAGRFPEAVATAEKARELAAEESKVQMGIDLQREIQLYQTNSSYRSTEN